MYIQVMSERSLDCFCICNGGSVFCFVLVTTQSPVVKKPKTTISEVGKNKVIII